MAIALSPLATTSVPIVVMCFPLNFFSSSGNDANHFSFSCVSPPLLAQCSWIACVCDGIWFAAQALRIFAADGCGEVERSGAGRSAVGMNIVGGVTRSNPLQSDRSCAIPAYRHIFTVPMHLGLRCHAIIDYT